MWVFLFVCLFCFLTSIVFYRFIYSLIFGCAESSLLRLGAAVWMVGMGGCDSLRCGGFSPQWFLLLQSSLQGTRAQALPRCLSSCGTLP